MASVIKRCGHANKARCQCNWVVRWRDASGKQREKSYLFDQKTLANDLAVRVEHDKRAGVYTLPSSETFGAYAERMITQRACSDATKRKYRTILRLHLADLAGRRLTAVAADRKGIKTLLTETLPARHLSRSQIAIAQVVITSTLNEAIRDGEIASHNVGGIRLAPVDKTVAETATITREQAELIAKNMPPELELTVWLGVGGGLRIGEVLGVRLSDFSADMTSLTVSRQVVSGTKTGPLKARRPGETRTVPVPGWLKESVQMHVQGLEQIAEIPQFEAAVLFPGVQGPYYAPRSLYYPWARAATAAGLPGLRFHALRHTFASVLLHENVPVSDVSRWLGHQNIQLTYSVYSHFIRPSFDRARAALDAW